MKETEDKSFRYPTTEFEPMVLRDTADAALARLVSVREAKAHLSALLDQVSGGQEITITSDGKPKARLVPTTDTPPRKVFRGMGKHLRSQPVHGGPTGEELIREDRDGRGW